MMTCPQEPIPAGWSVWRGAVPLELTQFAMDVRDHVRSYPYGQIAKTIQYQGQTVGAFVSHHTWTYRGGQLVTGICIPGVSLLIQQTNTPPASGTGASTDSLATPDPSAAVYGADDVPGPPEGTDWTLVTVGVAAIATVTAGFWLAIRQAGRASRK
jgi:hypothetical protein